MDAYVHVYTHLNLLQGSYSKKYLSVGNNEMFTNKKKKDENYKEYLKCGYSKKN